MRANERKVITAQPNRKIIRQYDKRGNLLYEWPSIRTLCASLDLDRRAVRRVINKQQGHKSVKSFVFVEHKPRN